MRNVDVNELDIGKMIFDRLEAAFGELKEVEAQSVTGSNVGRGKRYVPGEKTKVPFEFLMTTRLLDVEIRNLKDREQLDLSNSFVTMVMPADSCPLPLYAVDVDVHKGEYVHIIADLIPFSRNDEYLEQYSTPLEQLKAKYVDLPGMVLKTPEEIYKVFPIMKQFDAFSSRGKIFGNIPIAYGPQIVDIVDDYLGLYCSFVRNADRTEILQREEIRKEAAATKGSFKKMMAQMDFSNDMPNEPR